MKPLEALRTVLQGLENAGLAYMMTGGLVRNLYAIPRATNDADIVIQMEHAAFRSFAQNLPADLELDPQVSFEAITGSHRHILKLARSNFRIEPSSWAMMHITVNAFPDASSNHWPTSGAPFG